MGESNEPGGRGSLIFPPELLPFSLRSFYAVTKEQRAREPTFKLISRLSASTYVPLWSDVRHLWESVCHENE